MLHHRGDGGVALDCPDAGFAVRGVRDGYGDVSHGFVLCGAGYFRRVEGPAGGCDRFLFMSVRQTAVIICNANGIYFWGSVAGCGETFFRGNFG